MPLGLFRNIGPWEVIIVLFVILLFFGPKRLPEMGKSLGRGMREFKDSITGKGGDDEEEDAQIALAKAEAAAAAARVDALEAQARADAPPAATEAKHVS
jgi:sec-independent protein translocase protein TatA